MDIRLVGNNILTGTNEAQKTQASKDIRSRETGDRDGNGQMQHQGGQESHRQMTPEELQQAIEKLKSFSGIKDNQLGVKLVELNGKKFIFIEDLNGQVVRRIPEEDLWQLLPKANEEKPKGNLLDKAM